MLTMTTNCLKPTSRTFNDDDNESHKKYLMLGVLLDNEQRTMNNVNNVMTARSKTRPYVHYIFYSIIHEELVDYCKYMYVMMLI